MEPTEQTKSRERIDRAHDAIMAAFAGCTKEELCAALCAVAASSGLYDEAIRFAELAKVHRDAIVHAGGKH